MNTLFSHNHNAEKNNADDVIQLFNDCFQVSTNTILVGNAQEPIYLPANEQRLFNQVVFTHDYFSSALHEIAHWCIAGKERRTKTDYGYWYSPDGRTAEQQEAFERAEVKPQALECVFSMAANITFNVSIDNLQGEETCRVAFEEAVEKQVQSFASTGFNGRAKQFLAALHHFYKTPFLSSQSAISPSKAGSHIETKI